MLAPTQMPPYCPLNLLYFKLRERQLNLVKWIHLLREVHFDVGQWANEQRQMIS